MANTVQVKRSAVQDKVPLTSDLSLGEIAVNTYDGKMYIKKDDGTASVVEVSNPFDQDLNTTDTPTFVAITLSAPTTPTIFSASVVSDTIEISFSQSTTSNCDSHEVWASTDNIHFNLIAIVPQEDFAATIAVVDNNFLIAGTRYYRVYSKKNDVRSTALTGNTNFTEPSLDVTDMVVNSMIDGLLINWTNSDSRFYDSVEIYMDRELVLGDLDRVGATLLYSGNTDTYFYPVSQAYAEYYHQFWVEVVNV